MSTYSGRESDADLDHTPTPPVRLDVWADIACPWCYLGSARLDKVLSERKADGETIIVRHRPFELNPDMPPEGVPMAGFLEARMGSAAAVRTAHDHLTSLGHKDGIAYDFEAVGKAPNSRLAHHLVLTYDGDRRQRGVVRSLYKAYFADGLDITDTQTLVDVVTATTGEGRHEVLARLESPTDALDEALALGRRLGVSAVPTFVADSGTDIDPEIEISSAAVYVQGAQTPDILNEVIDEAIRRATAE
jgi:predicted DsbA family dithiol-disulfide isomerase